MSPLVRIGGRGELTRRLGWRAVMAGAGDCERLRRRPRFRVEYATMAAAAVVKRRTIERGLFYLLFLFVFFFSPYVLYINVYTITWRLVAKINKTKRKTNTRKPRRFVSIHHQPPPTRFLSCRANIWLIIMRVNRGATKTWHSPLKILWKEKRKKKKNEEITNTRHPHFMRGRRVYLYAHIKFLALKLRNI